MLKFADIQMHKFVLHSVNVIVRSIPNVLNAVWRGNIYFEMGFNLYQKWNWFQMFLSEIYDVPKKWNRGVLFLISGFLQGLPLKCNGITGDLSDWTSGRISFLWKRWKSINKYILRLKTPTPTSAFPTQRKQLPPVILPLKWLQLSIIWDALEEFQYEEWKSCSLRRCTHFTFMENKNLLWWWGVSACSKFSEVLHLTDNPG